MASPRLKLTYFDGYGRADAIRVALSVGNVAYEDNRVQLEDWPALRAAGTLPLGQLPVLEVDGQGYAQSGAQLRYVGRLTDLYPADLMVQIRVDEILETVLEMLNRAPQSADEQKKKAMRKEYAENQMATALSLVDRRIKESGSGGYSAGPDLTIADLALYSLSYLIETKRFDFVPRFLCDKYANVKRVLTKMAALPAVAEYFPPAAGTTAAEAAKPAGGKADKPVEEKEVAIPDEWRTFDTERALGKTCPGTDGLDYIQGGPVAIGAGTPAVVVFWASFAEGDFKVLSGVAELVAGISGVDAVAVSCDATKGGAESFLAKLGTAIPTAKILNLEVAIPLAFDPSKGFRKALQEATGKPSVGVSAVFLVDAAGSIVWFEQFGQMYLPARGQLGEQIRRHLAGEELLTNGQPPAEEEDEEINQSGTDVDSGDSDGLLF